jgi:hypothetical protein
MFNDLRCFNSQKKVWTLLSPDYSLPPNKRAIVPPARTSHSLCAYRDSIALFGGSGAFIQEIGLRMSFNDLWIWDSKSPIKRWVKIDDKGIVPKKRM